MENKIPSIKVTEPHRYSLFEKIKVPPNNIINTLINKKTDQIGRAHV